MSDHAPLNVVVLYDDRASHIATVREHLSAFQQYSLHRVFFMPATRQFYAAMSGYAASPSYAKAPPIDLALFDVVILHYSVRLCFPKYLDVALADQLTKFDGFKILFIQDEYDNTEMARQWMERLRFNVVFTCVPEAGRERVYPASRFPGTEFLSTLTGYVPEDPEIEHFVTPLRQRSLHLAYRGRMLPYFYGKLGYEKYHIGLEMKRLCAERGVLADIEVDEQKRIYGLDWYRFLGSARATLGTESGSNLFDFNGKVKQDVVRALRRNPRLTFEEAYRTILHPHDDFVRMNQISPKIFESIRLRTALVLFEGEYSGVVKPHEHFILLAKDFSNADEVFSRLKDFDYLEEMTGNAYRHVIDSGRYSYQTFVQGVDAVIAARVKRSPRCRFEVMPVLAHMQETGEIRVVAPANPVAFCLNTHILGGAMPREALVAGVMRRYRCGRVFFIKPLRMRVVELQALIRRRLLKHGVPLFEKLPPHWKRIIVDLYQRLPL